MKLSYNSTEPAGATEWCRDHAFLPMAITGHGPQVYQWDCFEGRAVRRDNPSYDPEDYDDMGFARSAWLIVPEPQGTEVEAPPPPPSSTFAIPPPATYGCESSYPDICLPHPLDEHTLECRHIPFRDFRVLAPDPYAFDQDGDGIGCEWPAAVPALTADPVVSVIAYYKFIDRREIEQAWALMGSAITATTTQETFASWFEDKVSIWREEVRVLSLNGEHAEVEAIVRSEDWIGGRQVSQRYREQWQLAFEKGKWKLNRLLSTVPVDAATSKPATGTVPTPTATPLPPPPTATLLPPVPTAGLLPMAPPASRACCKYCTTGKACGDSCISRSYTCHKPPGCACNAY